MTISFAFNKTVTILEQLVNLCIRLLMIIIKKKLCNAYEFFKKAPCSDHKGSQPLGCVNEQWEGLRKGFACLISRKFWGA